MKHTKFFRDWLLFIPLLALAACAKTPTERPLPTTGETLQVPARAEEFTRVTRELGPLFVSEGEWQHDAKVKPWSSWWYPVYHDVLFNGPNSTLAKYDAYMLKTHGKATRSADFERENLYHPNAVGWEGLCHAWAV